MKRNESYGPRCEFSPWHAALEAIFLLIVASDEYRCRWHIKLRSIDVSHIPLWIGVQILQNLLVADVLIYLCLHFSTFGSFFPHQKYEVCDETYVSWCLCSWCIYMCRDSPWRAASTSCAIGWLAHLAIQIHFAHFDLDNKHCMFSHAYDILLETKLFACYWNVMLQIDIVGSFTCTIANQIQETLSRY
jgi:hypothetical protein